LSIRVPVSAMRWHLVRVRGRVGVRARVGVGVELGLA
jgi:hypothetical protein